MITNFRMTDTNTQLQTAWESVFACVNRFEGIETKRASVQYNAVYRPCTKALRMLTNELDRVSQDLRL